MTPRAGGSAGTRPPAHVPAAVIDSAFLGVIEAGNRPSLEGVRPNPGSPDDFSGNPLTSKESFNASHFAS